MSVSAAGMPGGAVVESRGAMVPSHEPSPNAKSAPMLLSIDLHNHMPLAGADYRGPMDVTGHDVVRAAVAAGIDVLGVTDHFSLDFFHHVHAAAVGTDLLVLPGAEVRLAWGADEVHLIVTFPPDSASERFDEFVRALGLSAAHREHPAHRICLEADPLEAAALAQRLGGMTHVAHADRRFGSYRLLGSELLERLVTDAPVAAVEIIDLASAKELGPLADRVAVIQCSDSHHTDEIGRRRTVIEARESSFDGVNDALLRMRAGRGA